MAERLEDEPFHLVASHNQKGTRANVVSYLKDQKLKDNPPNFTVTSFGGHPQVKGNGYVPYYMVFDHTGKLVREHMCGAYHGGDGLKMIEWVDRMLEKAPAIYLGNDEFTAVPDIAAKVASKKNLAANVQKIEIALAAGAGDSTSELERIHDGVKRYRDGRMARAESLMAVDPAAVVPLLKDLAKELKGTRLAGAVTERLGELDGSEQLKASIAVAKSFGKIRKSLEKSKPCKPCKRLGSKAVDLTCEGCRSGNKGAFGSAVKKLEKLVAGNEGLPITKKVEAYLAGLK